MRRRQRDQADIEDALLSSKRWKLTPRGCFRWAVRFAQSQVTNLTPVQRQDRCCDLAQFAFWPLGVGLRKAPTESKITSAAIAGRRDSEQWTLCGQRHGNRVIVRFTVTRREMEETKRRFSERLFQEIIPRRELRYSLGGARLARWEESLERYVILIRDPWTDLALGHFCELAVRYGHTLRQCPAEAIPPDQNTCGRWFVPMVKGQIYCSGTCKDTMRVARQRARRHGG